ncbi:MAG TPA: TlpA disulfide reductase family protein [Solirubrobacteraceae bacterium]|nr:TlpA disulfide reductase family protein [Solirubrobacteraceae bacterium]
MSIAAAATAVVVLLVIGLIQLGGSSSPPPPSGLTLAQMRERLKGSPPPLAALHAQANKIIAGGLPALRARLAALRGTPVVINKWASWCEPCRDEFGVFQRVSVSRGRQVAFLGIDSGDTPAHALAFLRSFPVSYPSFSDPSGQAGESIADSAFTPVTVFINRSGSKFIHQGPFSSVAKLEQAVRRYALGA